MSTTEGARPEGSKARGKHAYDSVVPTLCSVAQLAGLTVTVSDGLIPSQLQCGCRQGSSKHCDFLVRVKGKGGFTDR